MKENIKDFVNRNRQLFDDQVPPATVWKRVASALWNGAWWDSVVLWRAAAVLFLCLSAGLVIVPRYFEKQKNQEVLSEFTDIEEFYKSQITEKVAIIEAYDGELNGFTHDFHQLDAMYYVLKEQLQNEPSEKVKDALILNLLIRIDFLNQRLQMLEKEFYRDEENGSIGA